MIRRLLAYCAPYSRWGVVLMLLGICYEVFILGYLQPMLVCNVAELLCYDGLEFRSVQSVTAHRRARQTLFRWFHDDGIYMGAYATKSDVPWILSQAEGEGLCSCAGGHKDAALEGITNQGSDKGLAGWQRWWQAHSHQTQAQWIMEGFEKAGIKLSLPPDQATCIKLLKMLGKNQMERENRLTESRPPPTLPGYVILNIRRVLRHHDFDGSKVTKEDIAADPTGEVLEGLKALMSARTADAFLSNPFQESPTESSFTSKLYGMHPLATWMHTGIAFVLFQSGFFLWLRARYRRKLSPAAAST